MTLSVSEREEELAGQGMAALLGSRGVSLQTNHLKAVKVEIQHC